MCGTVCMGAAGPPNLVWGGTGRVGLLITELQYTDSAQIVVRFVVSLPQAKRKRSDQRVSPTGLAGKRKLTATSSLLGYFSGLAKVADQPTSDL